MLQYHCYGEYLRIYKKHTPKSSFFTEVIDVLEMDIRFVPLGLSWDEMIESFDEYDWYILLRVIHHLPPFHAGNRVASASSLHCPFLEIIEDVLLGGDYTHDALPRTQVLDIGLENQGIIPNIINSKESYFLLEIVQQNIPLPVLCNLVDIDRLIDAARAD